MDKKAVYINFVKWLEAERGFTMPANDFFTKSLELAIIDCEGHMFSGIPFFHHYQGNSIYPEIHSEWILLLKGLLKQLHEPSLKARRIVRGIHLDNFLYQKEQLQYLFSQLTSQC